MAVRAVKGFLRATAPAGEELGPLVIANSDGTPIPGGSGGGGGLTDAELRATPVPVSMTGSPTGGLTDAELRASAVPVSGPLTDAQIRASALPVDVSDRTARLLGHVTIDNASLAVTGTFWPGTQPVSGTFWQATQPVSGPLTDTQLRASAVPVSDGGGSLTVDGTFWQATQPVSGPLTDTQLRASAVPVSGPLTDTQLRASAVPVSGPLTDTQLRASAVPVSGTFWQSTQPVSIAVPTSGGSGIHRIISTATTNSTTAKASAGQLYGIIAININAAVRYLKLYNKATNPTVGTDTPVMTIPIPGSTAGAGLTFNLQVGIEFTTGIAAALTTGVADSDNTAVAANEIVVHLLYK